MNVAPAKSLPVLTYFAVSTEIDSPIARFPKLLNSLVNSPSSYKSSIPDADASHTILVGVPAVDANMS